MLTRALTTPTMTEPVRSVRQKQQRLSVPMKTGLPTVTPTPPLALVPELASLLPFVAPLDDIPPPPAEVPATAKERRLATTDHVNSASGPLFIAL